jgi:hypothetical protein
LVTLMLPSGFVSSHMGEHVALADGTPKAQSTKLAKNKFRIEPNDKGFMILGSSWGANSRRLDNQIWPPTSILFYWR